MFTNQTRDKVGVMYGNPETVSGGKALGYYASIRLKISKVGVIEEGSGDNKEKTSVRTRVEAVKNKTYPPFKKEEYVIVFGKGIDNDAGVLDELIENDIIHKKGGWYEYGGVNIAQGLVNLKIWLAEHQEEFEKMKQILLEKDAPVVEEQKNEPIDAEEMTDEEIGQEVEVAEV
jgi:recombination protein RecA